jgi:hypothetical protein
VDEAVSDDTQAIDTPHPRSRRSSAPDPELLHRDVAALSAQIETGVLTEEDRGRMRDHLRTLANRAQWVDAEESRSFLLQKIEELWTALGEPA